MSSSRSTEPRDHDRPLHPASSHSGGKRRERASGEFVRIDSPAAAREVLGLPGSMSLTELKRRIWHMFPGLFPIASYIYPHKDPLSRTFQGIALGLMVVVTTSLLWRYHTIRRANESSNLGAIFGYAWSTIGMLLLFPKHAELGMLVLVVLAFGDGMATTCGMLFRGPRLPWNRDKTWIGTLAFVSFGGCLSSLAYWAEARPTASWTTAIACGFVAASVAAIAESLKSRFNDNIRVGIAAAATATLMQALLIGL